MSLAKIKILDARETGERIRSLIPIAKSIKIGAYAVTVQGLKEFEPELSTFLKNGAMTLLLGKKTLPEVYEHCEPKLAPLGRLTIGLIAEPTFHSKIFIFKLDSNSSISIVGSSNLTGSALTDTNIETNIELEDCSSVESSFDKYFDISEKDPHKIISILKELEKDNRKCDNLEKTIENKIETILEVKT